MASLVISGVFDGPLTGGLPKGIELYVVEDIPDLSIYGVGFANNGGGTDGEEFTFLPVSATAGQYIYVASDATEFTTFFGFAPDYTTGSASINGDDAIELFENGIVIDVFGDINTDGTGQPWEYLDGWAYRIDGTVPDGTFNIADWTFSGPNALDNETSNDTTTNPVPVGLFTADSSATPLPVDLSTYIRIGRYDLPEPMRTAAPTGSQLALEASAVTYNPDSDTLFVVGDEGTSIVQVTKTGQLLDSMTLSAGDFDDPEGLTYAGNGQFVLVEERKRQANLFTYVAGGTLTRSDVQTVKLGTTIGNIGLEGISFDPETGGFILVKETDPQSIFQTDIDFAAGTATNGSPTTENSTNLFDPTLAGLTDIADVFALSNLGANDNLLVLSQEDGRIVNIDRTTGATASTLNIASDPGNPLTVADQGHEGITMDNDGLLYVVSENGGGDSDHPQLWVYAPSSFVYDNAAPVAVSLSNVTTNLAENSDTSSPIKVGNIIISDDALGTNNLSLTGADAGAFEIVGTELFLAAGTALDFETQPSYEVTVNVDDPSLGNDPDASMTFTLAITDTTDTPAALIISEVAPWSSGNSPGVGADWFEVTNTSTTAVDITGWVFDDDSADFASGAALSGVTSIDPGQSVIFVDGDANTVNAFVDTWFGGTLPSGVAIGTHDGPGLSTGGDAVNLFDATGTLVTGVTFGNSPSGSPFATFDNAAGQPTVSTLSVAGVNGAFSVIDAGVNEAAVLIGSPGAISGAPISTTLVAIAATDATAAEESQNPGTFTVLRTGDTTAELAVTYIIGGDADAADYTLTLPTTVTIPAGASEATIIVTPVDDVLAESTESVTLTLEDTAAYDVAANAASATVTIADNDTAIANFDLQITEMWPGNGVGSDLTEDWFEITNIGPEAWVSGVAPDLYYDDSPPTPANANLISGLTQIDPGESAIVVVGTAADAQTFASIWGSVIDLTGVNIGFTDGAGLGSGGDGVSLFVGLPGDTDIPADFEAYPDATGFAGQSYDVDLAAFSVAGQNGSVATQLNDANESAVGSPGEGDPIVTEEVNVFISEFHYDNAGTDTGEFIEVTADAGADLTGYSLVLYNGNGGGTYNTVVLSDVVSDQADGLGTVVVEFPSNGIQNGAPDGIALVDADGNVVEFISYEGTMIAADGPAAGMTSTDVGVSETFETPAGQSLQLIDGVWTGPAAETRGEVNSGDNGGGTGATPATIAQIQGSGFESPLLGSTVATSGIVTKLLSNGFYMQTPDGDGMDDGDATTSEGLWVFTGSAPTVTVGDAVEVTGGISEFFGLTQLSADAIIVQSSGNDLPNPVQISLSGLQQTDLEAYEGMRFELVSSGAEPLVIIENFNLDRFGEITIAEGNQTQPNQIFDPATQQAEIQALINTNTNERLLLDDGNGSQNPDEFPYIPANVGDNGNGFLDAGDTFSAAGPTVRLGAEVSDVKGVLSFGFSEYRLLVDDTITIDPATNEGARPANTPEVGGGISVASFNVLNYFTTIDVSGAGTGPDGTLDPRGADSASELARQTAKLVAALAELDADVVGLQEIENNGTVAIATLVDELNAFLGADIYAYVDPTGTGDFIGTDAITTGLIYKPSEVSVAASDVLVFEEASAATTFALADVLNPFASPDDRVGDFQRNRPAVAATFQDAQSGEQFTVAVNHFKSKGDSNLEDVVLDAQFAGAPQADIEALLADPNYDQGDGQGFWNQVRADAGAELAAWLTDTSANGYAGGTIADPDFIVLGDLNAYAKEDPVNAVEAGGFTDLIDAFVPGGQAEAYSFVFDGQRGSLDHALGTSSLTNQVTGVAEWHINADEPDLLNYDESFNNSAFFDDNLFGSSDHEPLIVGLDLFTPINDNFGNGDDFVEGTRGNDIIGGDNGDDTLFGSAGNDILTGGRGADELLGGEGDDILEGGKGDDLIDGGIDHDTAVFDAEFSDINFIFISGTADNFTITVKGLGTDTVTNVEMILFTGGPDPVEMMTSELFA